MGRIATRKRRLRAEKAYAQPQAQPLPHDWQSVGEDFRSVSQDLTEATRGGESIAGEGREDDSMDIPAPTGAAGRPILWAVIGFATGILFMAVIHWILS